MIYCVPIEQYPKDGMFIEELKYKDENDFEWRIARIKNGFMVRYFGDEYFKESTFECKLSNGGYLRVRNTNCIFFKDVDFETFCEMRDIIKIGYTDDIWETFEELFTERFEHDRGMLKSEMVNAEEKKHEISTVKCDLCGKKWVAVRPKGLTGLECLNCGNMVQFENV